jgi:prolipoprotein diacylglyceryltransferase
LFNWWILELYGTPTSLPWGLKIDPEHRVTGYENFTTFHPTFLYEFVYDLVGVGILLLLDKRYRFKPPALFALYVSYYTAGRFLEELIRIDPGHHFAGLRLNAWVSIVVFVCSTSFFVWWQFLRGRDEGEPREPGQRRLRFRREKREPEKPAMAIPRGRVR